MTGKGEMLQMDILHRMAYADKKVTRSQIKEINIFVIVDKHEKEKLSLKQASVMIVALAKVVARRFRILIEDCSHFVQQISKDVSSTARNIRIPSSRAITLNVEGNPVLTDDGVDIDDVEEDLVPNRDLMLDVDFGDFPSVEQVRNSVVQSSGIFGGDSSAGMVQKKRKVAEDRITEMDESSFKGGLRAAADILKRQESSVREQIKQRLRIDPWIAAVFRRTEKEGAAVEMLREPSLRIEELSQSGLACFPDDAMTGGFSDLDGFDFPADGLDLSSLPEAFRFGHAVEHQHAPNKASCFFSLLELATKGKITVQQAEPFSEIECFQISQ